MKTRQALLLSFVAAALLNFATVFAAEKAAPAKADASRIEVIFKDADKYTDAKDSSMDTDKGRDYILGEIKSFIQKNGERFLPKGQKVQVTFTEVDLAGEYEPWRTGSSRDIRLVKDIYPPRFDLSFKIMNEAGETIREGKAELRDLGFMTRLVIDRNDPLKYEKDMLTDWMRKDLPAPGK